jgi:hypothetical protein
MRLPPCYKVSLPGKTGRSNQEDKRGVKQQRTPKRYKRFPLFFNLISLYQ